MANEDARKLFVAGLSESITEEALREVFEAAGGTVVDVSLPRDRATGRPRGFGFVTFSSPEEATQARGTLDGSLQAGRSMSVRPFSSEPPRRGESRGEGAPGGGAQASEDRTLYVGNLPYDASQQEVTQLLSGHGVESIVRVHLPAGPDGRPRGFGFVTLGSAEAANEAIIQLRGVEVRGRRLLVNIAHPRGSSPAGAGGRPSGPRPPRDDGWAGDPRFQGPPPGAELGTAAPDGRRRGAGGSGGDWAGGGEDAEGRKPQKRRGAGAGRKRGTPPGGERGGGGNWRSWSRDDDD
jgi:RNA recognition motif-containing protein